MDLYILLQRMTNIVKAQPLIKIFTVLINSSETVMKFMSL